MALRAADLHEFHDLQARSVRRAGFSQFPMMEQDVEHRDTVRFLLGAVSPRQRTVITRLFGLDGDAPCSQKELAAEMGVTCPRIFQLKEGGFFRMRRRAGLIRAKDTRA